MGQWFHIKIPYLENGFLIYSLNPLREEVDSSLIVLSGAARLCKCIGPPECRMIKKPARRSFTRAILALAVVLLASACSFSSASPTSGSIPGETFPVNSIFNDFYESLGGYEILGPAITPIFLQENLQMQYTETSLLVYDPLATPNFYLAPLGIDLGYSPSGPAGGSNPVSASVFGGFLNLYYQLGGEALVGPPLSEAKLNTEKNRIEQHFTNLGFYQSLDDPDRRAYLLAYGVLACSKDCAYSPPESAIIENGASLEEPFASSAAALGDAFTGEVLAGPHHASDGYLEVIFENLAMYIDPEYPSRTLIRPIVESVGFQRHPLTERMNSDKVVFYIVEDGMGYNIPIIFSDFLSGYGNLTISGPPISELFQLESEIFRQCFENLCLDYHINNDPEERILIAPLGVIYKAYTLQPDETSTGLHVPEMPSDFQLRVWEASPYITSQQEQTIFVSVFQGSAPASAVETVLSVTLPDGSVGKYFLQPTNEAGQSSIPIPPIPAPNGTMIFYEVCVGDGTLAVCVQDNFLIWGNP